MQTRNNLVLKKLDYYIGIPLLYFLGFFHGPILVPFGQDGKEIGETNGWY